jgi:uncharacterized membrane protein YphA (DoxX/SURF4 family)
VEGFSTNVIAAYFPFLPGPPAFWTYLSAGFEIGGSFCITVGLFARPAAALLAGTMVNAVAFQLMKFGLQGWPFGLPPGGPAYTFEPSLAFLAVSTRIALAGAGRFAYHSSPGWHSNGRPAKDTVASVCGITSGSSTELV